MTLTANLPAELILAPAEGVMLNRILNVADTGGLSRAAFRNFDTARRQTAWGQRHFRRLSLIDPAGLVGSAEQCDLTGRLDGQLVHICGIGAVHSHAPDRAGGQVPAIVARLSADAERRGADVVLLFGKPDPDHARLPGFEPLPTTEVEIHVQEDSRRGAPMILVRDGTDRDLAAVEAIGRADSGRFRFHLERDADFIKHTLTICRLRAGLDVPGARQVRFVVAEEGFTAAAYVIVSVVGHTWTIDACGDRDPAGARVGAILQALIANEAAEQRPVIRAWLPPGFVPPQITLHPIDSPPVVRLRMLRPSVPVTPLSSGAVLFWRGDVLSW